MTEATSGYLNRTPRGYHEALLARLTALGREAIKAPVTEVRNIDHDPVAYAVAADDWDKIQAVLDELEKHIDTCDAEQAAIDEAEGHAMVKDAFSAQFRK